VLANGMEEREAWVCWVFDSHHGISQAHTHFPTLFVQKFDFPHFQVINFVVVQVAWHALNLSILWHPWVLSTESISGTNLIHMCNRKT